MRHLLLASVLALPIAAPAAAAESAQSLAARMAALAGYAMGALAECGMSDAEAQHRAEQLLLAMSFAARDPADFDNARSHLLLGVPAGRDAVRTKQVSCTTANERLPALLNALSGPP